MHARVGVNANPHRQHRPAYEYYSLNSKYNSLNDCQRSCVYQGQIRHTTHTRTQPQYPFELTLVDTHKHEHTYRDSANSPEAFAARAISVRCGQVCLACLLLFLFFSCFYPFIRQRAHARTHTHAFLVFIRCTSINAHACQAKPDARRTIP